MNTPAPDSLEARYLSLAAVRRIENAQVRARRSRRTGAWWQVSM